MAYSLELSLKNWEDNLNSFCSHKGFNQIKGLLSDVVRLVAQSFCDIKQLVQNFYYCCINCEIT